MGARPDPVSVDSEDAAARALARARARQGQWVTVTIPRASARRFIQYFGRGIDLLASDGNDPPVNRQVRGFIRALYREHKRSGAGALVWEGGEYTLKGWEIRIMTARHGDSRLPPRRKDWVSPEISDTTANPRRRDW